MRPIAASIGDASLLKILMNLEIRARVPALKIIAKTPAKPVPENRSIILETTSATTFLTFIKISISQPNFSLAAVTILLIALSIGSEIWVNALTIESHTRDPKSWNALIISSKDIYLRLMIRSTNSWNPAIAPPAIRITASRMPLNASEILDAITATISDSLTISTKS